MSETTNIAWANSTFNPWVGCTKVGPGCEVAIPEQLIEATKLGIDVERAGEEATE